MDDFPSLVAGARALAIADRLGDTTLRTVTETYLELVYFYRADHARVVELATANLSAPLSGGYIASSIPRAVYARCYLLRSLAELGRFAEALPQARDVIEQAEPTQSHYPLGMAHMAAGWCLVAKGDWAEAWPHIERGTAEYRRGSIYLSLPHGIATSARVLAQLGRMGEAASCLREGEDLLVRRIAGGTVDQAGMNYQWLGRAALLLGRLDDTRRLCELSLKYSPSHPGFAAHALHLLGDLASHPDQLDVEQAETHYRKALTLAEPRGMRPLVAHCHLGLGKLYQRTCNREQACEHLATATSLYREMDMRFWLEQAEAEK
jgi:tetratricopeptide (TPR) repeat protein